ncbi:MAG: ABC transporter ATP-binding protein [Actinomycetota bacterium]|nr:ABC transporter ATP-binding protein [Actinomycetota bacterium]MDQ3575672.1 ABC transporter ATP-binding protein [Actinomycetota bacterium]
MGAAITVQDLHKSYGQLEAVQGVDLEVHEGEIFAFLGPNGAGKTTTVEILEGYRPRNSGHVEVLGADPSRSTAAWRSRIGVVLQTCQVWSLLTVRESLELHAGYYPSPRDVDETMALAGLAERGDQRAGKLSGGQQRRLDVALALIGDPELLFLDEPTTGFDPAARRAAWEVVSSLGKLGKTVFLTTHYMEEAEHLADRVAIIKDGRIVAQGRPDELAGGERAATSIRFRLPRGLGAGELPAGIAPRAVEGDGGLRIASREPVRDLAELCGWAVGRGIELEDLEAVRPSLEDVYLELTKGSEA